MKRNRSALPLLLFIWVAVFMVNCGKKEVTADGEYHGTATNAANSGDVKNMNVTITSTANPVAGSYSFSGGGINDKGKISGSVIGLILDLKFVPDGGGTTYAFAGNFGDKNATINGTMSGVETGKTVKYTVDLKR